MKKDISDYGHRVYFAGNFEFMYKDYTMELLSKDYRSKVLGNVELLMRKPKDDYGYTEINDNVLYSGPYYFYEDGVDGESIVHNEYDMVERSTDVVFLLDNVNCPGTVAEMIHALFSDGQPNIWIFYIEQKPDDGEPEKDVCNSNWYPVEMCRWMGHKRVTLCPCKTRDAASDMIIKLIDRMSLNSSETSEIGLFKRIVGYFIK